MHTHAMDTEQDVESQVLVEIKRQTKVVEDVRTILVLWSILFALGLVIYVVSTVQHP